MFYALIGETHVLYGDNLGISGDPRHLRSQMCVRSV